MSESPKINLVFLASIGRSGSTLLESMLGAHSGMATMGELHIWTHEIRQGGVRPCACGEFVQTCPFWTEMQRRVDPLLQPDPKVDFFRENHDGGRTLRIGRLKEFASTPAVNLNAHADIMTYGRNNRDIFQAFLDLTRETTGVEPGWLIDASKDPYRLLWLLRSEMFNIKVVHLVKDPRAFIYSATKAHISARNAGGFFRRYYYGSRQSLAWVIQNSLFSRIANNHLDPSNYLLLKYEDLATNPSDSFRLVCDRIGCSFEQDAIDNFREGAVHTIAGNPMRYQSGGIRLDEKWKTKLPGSSRLMAETITGRVMSRYGYE